MTLIDFAAVIQQESARFRAALRTAGDRRVPTCPDWSGDDLLWHLTEVQWFWGTVLARDVDPQELQHPSRPEGHDATLAAFDTAHRALHDAVTTVAPDEPRWMWAADASLHTAGYIARRQAHEALIHRVDAELTAGLPVSGIDPALALDGIDEVVRVMYGREHPLLAFLPSAGQVVALVADDCGGDDEHRWVLQLGRETGTIPDTGEQVDDANFRPLETGAEAAAVLSGPAADLDRWLWNRPTAVELTRTGDRATLAGLDAVLSEGLR